MKEESYDLVFKGELLQGFEQADVTQEIIKSFKVTEAVALQLLNKKNHIIKNNVTWKQAVQYQKSLKSIGLIIYINLRFDADIFRESLTGTESQSAQLTNTPIDNKIEDTAVPTSPDITFRLLSFDIKKLYHHYFLVLKKRRFLMMRVIQDLI